MFKVYCLFDNKTEIYNIPFYAQNDETAKAEIAIALSLTDEEKIDVNPVDYDLFFLGEYDAQTGKFDNLDVPKHICNLNIVVNKE